MKRLFLPLVLLAFAIVCLSIIHIDNVNRLKKEASELPAKQKSQLEIKKESEANKDTAIIIDR